MKTSVVCLIWSVVLGAMVLGLSGCVSGDPDNDSARPWNSPEGFEGSMPIEDQQHGE